MIVLETEGVIKQFKQYDNVVTAVNRVSLSVEEGEFIAITGESGSGKSTFINLCAGLDLPNAGKIRVLGNAAGSGASMILLSDKELAHSEQIAAQAKTVDLSTSPVFMEKYVDYMYF